MTQEQLDDWFVYHAPTPETQPKYDAIRKAEQECREAFDDAMRLTGAVRAYATINAAAKAYAVAIDQNAPDCADKSAAIRCVRLARNAANEVAAVTQPKSVWGEGTGGGGSSSGKLPPPSHIPYYGDQLTMARWQACAAIALGGK